MLQCLVGRISGQNVRGTESTVEVVANRPRAAGASGRVDGKANPLQGKKAEFTSIENVLFVQKKCYENGCTTRILLPLWNTSLRMEDRISFALKVRTDNLYRVETRNRPCASRMCESCS